MSIEYYSDYSGFSWINSVEFEELNPDITGVEPKQEKLFSRYNPFTRAFEKVPLNWRLKRNVYTNEWHFRPDS